MEKGGADMYDMSGFDYDIRDVVRILNLRIRRKIPIPMMWIVLLWV